MSASKRADLIQKVHKVLNKHYKATKPVERPVLEQLLYAHCLEDTRPEAADECFARLQESFFDWNEVRVTTVRELSEVLRGAFDPTRAATRIKQTLHSVFEAIYSFDLEPLRKQNLGAAVKQLQGYRGTTPFAVSYAIQTSLGGHAIPVSDASLEIFLAIGVISDKEKAEQAVPGLERAVPKTKGFEFGSLLNQLASDYAASPLGAGPRGILMEIDPAAKNRLPKRGVPRKSEESKSEPEAPANAVAEEKKPSSKPRKTITGKPTPAKEPDPVDADDMKSAKSPPKKKAAKKKDADIKPAKKKSNGKKDSKPIAKKASPSAKKSTSKQLARRKPR
jgi:endonuclease-3